MKQTRNLVPRDFLALSGPTGNIYATTTIIAKRAKQIATKTKEELEDKLADFVATTTDNLEEIFENKEQIELSKTYEKRPNPTTIATEEFLANEIMYRYPDLDTKE
jgi:DNA-directed RNA polymerase subunit K/omega